MPQLKLSYFDFPGGRGEPIRLALAIGGIPFEDDRIPVADWPLVKDQTPFHAVPLLEIDGTRISQTNTLCRYVGKLAGLYPDDALEAARCDEVMDAVEDIVARVVTTFDITDDAEKRAAREELVDGLIALYLKSLQSMLEARGGQWFAGNQLTVADLRVYVWIKNVRSGVVDYVPPDLADRLAPALSAHCDRVASHPAVVAYYQGNGKS